jgi:hypothetical protein
MNNALDRERDEITAEQFDELRAYFDMVAHQLRNV